MATTPQQQQPPPPAKQPKGRGPSVSSSRSGGLMTHFAMTELKQRILTSLNKLADRDTQQIAMEDLEKTIEGLSPEGIIVCLNCLYDTDFQHKGIVRKECVKLLGTMATTHTDLISPHLTKIVIHIVKRLKDPDSSVRDACHATMGVLAAHYLHANGAGSSLVSVFVKPLFEAMGEQTKSVQSGSAMCLAKLIENAKDPPLHAFQRLCPKICKLLSNPNFLAKAQLLSVFGSLSQVGAISQQHLLTLMPCITESLESTDWATRKGAADTLSRMATHSSHILTSFKTSTIALLEACRFDKVKPVRDSMVEALQLWKNIPGPEDESNSAAPTLQSLETQTAKVTQTLEKVDLEHSNSTTQKVNSPHKVSLEGQNLGSNSLSNLQGGNISEKTAGFLKKKAPVLTDKELNPDFFQKLEKKGPDEWQVEVAVSRGRPPSAQSENGQIEASAASQEGENLDVVGMQNTGDTYNGLDNTDDFSQDQWMERRSLRNRDSKARNMELDDWNDLNQRDTGGTRTNFLKAETYGDSQITSGKGNWVVIQRQLSQMERQQAMLMEMLQDFMGNSQHSMVSLENRVRSLERVVDDMARDLAFSAGRRAGSHMMGYEGPTNRNGNRYHGAPDYPGPKFSKGNDGRASFSEWYTQPDSIPLGARGPRESQWRSSDSGPDMWDNYSHGSFRNGHLPEGQVSSRRGIVGISNDGRFSRQEHQDGEQVVSRRGWERGSGPVREGPSARSVWQASKDEATLAAIRVAGEDAQTSRGSSRVAVPELDGEVLQYSNPGQGKLWTAWNRALESLHVGDIDLAYGEVLITGDELLLARLMSKSGPVLDQLSTGTAADALHAIGQFLQQQSFFDFGIQWIQQLADMVVESDPDCLGLPLDVKKELLLGLQESSGMELPEDWEGNTVDEILLQLASAWSIDLPQNGANN
ncbi:hypothetical protein SUGI_0623200 [Cryptomeria japonica]|uniref:microtubule-associated protein TORTIFOLIA1 isoform X2 n=1 Tax=Cryptomeria japonica TaxID=3369 RepID=UPI0024148D5A|nr:microtubule-associated protein TORTIFOLIA1 isoform X2 [Cryptomeria japonica]GLJ31123.1 hypothetical protein SUGI_0623200 [Cryptomeria japonica]